MKKIITFTTVSFIIAGILMLNFPAPEQNTTALKQVVLDSTKADTGKVFKTKQ